MTLGKLYDVILTIIVSVRIVNMNVKNLFLQATKSRVFVALWAIIFLQTVVLATMTLLHAHSGLTVQIHCDLSGGTTDCTHAEAPWYYLFNFAGFAVIIFAINILISLKLLEVKGRSLALGWLWLTVAILVITTVLIAAILRVVGL